MPAPHISQLHNSQRAGAFLKEPLVGMLNQAERQLLEGLVWSGLLT